jgi:hypothetical protein
MIRWCNKCSTQMEVETEFMELQISDDCYPIVLCINCAEGLLNLLIRQNRANQLTAVMYTQKVMGQ